jgi:hypothetical protein
MLTGIDHFIVAGGDPDRAADELEAALGLRAGPGGRHPAYGSFNRLVWLGDSYLEILGISDRELAAAAWFGPRALEVLDHAGAGYVGLSLVADDLVADVAALRAQGSSLGEPAAGQRARPDGGVVRWKVATPAVADPELGCVFLIEHDPTGAEWTPKDRARRAADVHPLGGPVRLVRVELPVSDMKLATMQLHRHVGPAFRPSLAGAGARDASVGSQTLRLVRAGAGRLPTVVVRGGSESRAAELFGCRWLVEPAAAT